TIPDNNNKIIALILARGGSKRIPDKNKKLLNGKPLISYTFEAVTKSKCFEQIVVSTDDKDISKIAKDYGIQIDI
ncbi:MAG: NTP transferase domain-containing protein, partial [Candidatus Dadabacteria bacterium]|nr:NTP transferase domain-containing protein [Candidatus Dadabacteria bacterium]